MRYYKYPDEYSEIAGGTTYLETEDGWALRQLTVNGNRYFASNINDPLWGMSLAEGQVDYDELTDEHVTEISQQEFEAVWDAVLVTHDSVWRQSQIRYPIGMQVQGALLLFYPQGVIVQLDQETVGIADYAACQASTTPDNLYPHHKVTATVTGYDERQHWIVLDTPRVHAESLSSSSGATIDLARPNTRMQPDAASRPQDHGDFEIWIRLASHTDLEWRRG